MESGSWSQSELHRAVVPGPLQSGKHIFRRVNHDIRVFLHHGKSYHSIIQSHHQTISDTNIYHSILQSFDRAVCCSIIVAFDRSLFDFLPAQTGRLGAKFKTPGHIQGVQEKKTTTGPHLSPKVTVQPISRNNSICSLFSFGWNLLHGNILKS